MFGARNYTTYYNGMMIDVTRRSVWFWQGQFDGKGYKRVKFSRPRYGKGA